MSAPGDLCRCTSLHAWDSDITLLPIYGKLPPRLRLRAAAFTHVIICINSGEKRGQLYYPLWCRRKEYYITSIQNANKSIFSHTRLTRIEAETWFNVFQRTKHTHTSFEVSPMGAGPEALLIVPSYLCGPGLPQGGWVKVVVGLVGRVC